MADGRAGGLPADLRLALPGKGSALSAWHDITPLARNEFIFWVEDAKQEVGRCTPSPAHGSATIDRC